MDKIRTKQFKDRGRLAWQYLVEAESGKKYEVNFDVTNMGHVREILVQKFPEDKMIYNREYVIGDNQKITWAGTIENDGVL